MDQSCSSRYTLTPVPEGMRPLAVLFLKANKSMDKGDV